jgi:DNA-binding transcriptional MerR regulator
LDLLRKKDLHLAVDMPKSTVADWIEDFSVYIPKTKIGNVTYYKPEAIDVLKFIKECRAQNYQKPQIYEMIAEKGFAITVEEAVDDIKTALNGGNYRDTLLAVMETTGQAVAKIADQEEEIKELRTKQDETVETISVQNERIEKVEKKADEIESLRRELEELKKELAATKEENKKGIWARFFGR